jgi:hypothetical protein
MREIILPEEKPAETTETLNNLLSASSLKTELRAYFG